MLEAHCFLSSKHILALSRLLIPLLPKLSCFRFGRPYSRSKLLSCCQFILADKSLRTRPYLFLDSSHWLAPVPLRAHLSGRTLVAQTNGVRVPWTYVLLATYTWKVVQKTTSTCSRSCRRSSGSLWPACRNCCRTSRNRGLVARDLPSFASDYRATQCPFDPHESLGNLRTCMLCYHDPTAAHRTGIYRSNLPAGLGRLRMKGNFLRKQSLPFWSSWLWVWFLKSWPQLNHQQFVVTKTNSLTNHKLLLGSREYICISV